MNFLADLKIRLKSGLFLSKVILRGYTNSSFGEHHENQFHARKSSCYQQQRHSFGCQERAKCQHFGKIWSPERDPVRRCGGHGVKLGPHAGVKQRRGIGRSRYRKGQFGESGHFSGNLRGQSRGDRRQIALECQGHAQAHSEVSSFFLVFRGKP